VVGGGRGGRGGRGGGERELDEKEKGEKKLIYIFFFY